MNKNKSEAMRWLSQAEKDLESARWNIQGGFFPQSCFLAQQSGEKILKGYLYGQGERLVLGHSLLELLNRCLLYNSKFESLTDACRLLDRFYIPTRYPNGLPDGIPQTHYVQKDAMESVSAVETILSSLKPEILLLPE